MNTKRKVQVTNHYGHTYKGDFLGFGIEAEEFTIGAASYTVAIVETSEGKVNLEPLNNIKFLS